MTSTNTSPHRAAAATPPDPMCDHTMACMLITNHARELLLVEARDGTGMAPPATHLSDHVDLPTRPGAGGPRHQLDRLWRAATDSHVTETTNLTPDTSAAGMALALDRWGDLPCDRPTAEGMPTGHQWVIYSGTATGELFPSPYTTRGAAWHTPSAVQLLAARTLDWVLGKVPDHEIRYLPGLAPIWVWWLHLLGWLPNITDAEALAALTHAAAAAGDPDPDRTATMTVTVRDRRRESPWGSGLTNPRTTVATISAYCAAPGCRTRRGAPQGNNQCDDSAYYWVQTWTNPCSHVDMYDAVLREAEDRLARRAGEWRRDDAPAEPAMTDRTMDLVLAGVHGGRNSDYSLVISQSDTEVRLKLRADAVHPQAAVFTWHPAGND